ncbi:tRNA (adenosine(37)-N6)-dimethylallyltransferase MiaA [Mucilaginibacter sp.]|uniref:tRNA (adenosine(37)-N6)-dimethylallyltransferase MiaA n=1 Tax=Mucilaginibacter sp. TaxID=1882438 RepID=UPI000CBCF515|nr:tRNA (adenosine(37)-N6)-dimethylallyltransferase MiaA [Mucilaginibacter sp.]PLW90289.1 MAG: tRNA (adenosine(37)-N6)-dimethylallyltransferase MiaA [Mucilaginibacter sp.]HEK22236.1 tRNA (adenosine(37)-N6)-dimethylallyltransferase MiaA [Bacteroidota bacterium]
MNATNPTLIVIAGPTASGKTAAAIQLAQHYNTVIVSADSRQFFREMSIGTAKPTTSELAAAPHYFIDTLSVTEPYSVGDYERECLALLEQLFKTYKVVIMVGGSGLYIKAVTEGFDDLPTASPDIRDRLNTELAVNGIAELQQRLKLVDPDYYHTVDINNPQRVIRALEIYEATGKPMSGYLTGTKNQRGFDTIKIGIDLPREELYNRINMRVDAMMLDGLLPEVEKLYSLRSYGALNTVGYVELFDYLDGKVSLSDAIDKIKQNTRRFAKRQLTWFRKDNELHWLNAAEIISFTEKEVVTN